MGRREEPCDVRRGWYHWTGLGEAGMYITPLILKPPMCTHTFNGLFTLTDPDSDSNTDSNPIPVVGS